MVTPTMKEPTMTQVPRVRVRVGVRVRARVGVRVRVRAGVRVRVRVRVRVAMPQAPMAGEWSKPMRAPPAVSWGRVRVRVRARVT